MISAVGGTLGLFTGISIITFVEIVYWSFKLSAILLGKMKDNVLSYGKSMYDEQEKEKNAKSSEEVFAFQITNGLKVPPSNIWKRIHIIWRKKLLLYWSKLWKWKVYNKTLLILPYLLQNSPHTISNTTWFQKIFYLQTLTLHFQKMKNQLNCLLRNWYHRSKWYPVSKIQREKTQKLFKLFPDFISFLELNFDGMIPNGRFIQCTTLIGKLPFPLFSGAQNI